MAKPTIRFKGYTEDWEQRKLGNITVKIGSGKTPLGGKSAYVETGIPLIRSQNVNGDKVDFADIVYIDEATDELMANSRVYTNDVLLNITGASIGRSAVYKGLESANVNQHVCIIRPTEGHQPDFIQLNLSSDNGQKQIDASQAGGGREGLNFQEIGKMQFSFPSLNEQKAIGRYFNCLDHLITLHQRKCEETKILKKYMLQKMFPQNGQKVPEIRFKDFIEDWEQRKLGEVCQITMGQSPDGSTYSEEPSDYILVQGNADLKDGWVEPRIWTTQKTKTAQAGDLIMSVRAPAGAMGKTAYDVVLGRGVAGIKGNEFVYQLLVKMDSDGSWKKMAAGSTFESINSDVVKKAEILLPQDIEEQNKIGSYFMLLDHLITLHQRKCEELKNIKKFMLQNMFV